jgi:hypothetical protein
MQEGQAGIKKEYNAAAFLCYVNYLEFLRPAADRAVSIFPGLIAEVAHTGFSGLIRLLKTIEEGRSNFGLFASMRSTASHGACYTPHL